MRGWTSAALSIASSTYLIAVSVIAAASVPPQHFINAPAGRAAPNPWLPHYSDCNAAAGMLAIGAVAATLAVATAVRCKRHPAQQRTSWWLAVAAALDAARGGPSHLPTSSPPQGGIMTVLQVLVTAVIAMAMVGGILDPRVGWAPGVTQTSVDAHRARSLHMATSRVGQAHPLTPLQQPAAVGPRPATDIQHRSRRRRQVSLEKFHRPSELERAGTLRILETALFSPRLAVRETFGWHAGHHSSNFVERNQEGGPYSDSSGPGRKLKSP